MPELPEMQALAERLDVAVGGAVLSGITLMAFAALKTFAPDPATLVGRACRGVGRRGKYLVFDHGDGLRVLIHLSQGGRVDVEAPARATKPKQGVVRFTFGNEHPSILVKEIGTERKAGWWVLAAGDDGPLDRLGPEPGMPAFDELITTSQDGRRVHTILRDQRTVSGIGRGYTNDALHRAKVSPYASLKALGADERAQLLRSIHEVVTEGLVHERARQGGLPNKVGDHWMVHRRHGEPCPACGDVLQRVSYERYEVTYCPACQTGGKVLADRRLSRLLK